MILSCFIIMQLKDVHIQIFIIQIKNEYFKKIINKKHFYFLNNIIYKVIKNDFKQCNSLNFF